MLDLNRDIHSLTDFKRRTAVFMKQLKAAGRPVVLTVNGKAALIVQDAKSYQNLLEAADRFDTIAALQEGLAESARGEGASLGSFDKAMRARHGLSR